MPTFFSQALGCRVNQAEKTAIDYQLLRKGYRYSKDNPDIFILNTCTVTHKADRESRQIIYQAKKNFPQAKIVVTGCAATYWLREKLDKRLGIDLIVDNQNKELIVRRILHLFRINRSINLDRKIFIDKYLSSKRVIIKIQDGCHRFCSFCIVPYLRGLPRSISSEEIIKKINLFQKEFDIKEVILTAINTEAYGRDINMSFIDLLKTVIEKTSVERISFGSIHPWSVDKGFLNFYQKVNPLFRLVSFFHIPLQSGSNRILTLMKRGYEKEEFEEKLEAIKKINERAFLATDVIVGFLNETDDDFNQTYQFLERSPIAKFHIFRYSPRKRTAAFFLGKRLKMVDEKTKTKRAKVLRELSEKKYNHFLQSLVGIRDKVLVLKKKVDNESFEGLLSNQIPIIIQAKASDIGQIMPVKVELYKKGRLFGKIIKN